MARSEQGDKPNGALQRVRDFVAVYKRCSDQKMIASTGAATVLWFDDLAALIEPAPSAAMPSFYCSEGLEDTRRSLIAAQISKKLADLGPPTFTFTFWRSDWKAINEALGAPASADRLPNAPSMDDLAECWSSIDWQERAERAVDKGRDIETDLKHYRRIVRRQDHGEAYDTLRRVNLDLSAQIAKLEAAASSDLAQERTPADYAIEHGGYLAKSAEDMLAALNGYWDAELREEPVEVEVEAAKALVSEHYQGLRSAIYEFRKRADRVLVTPSASESPMPEQLKMHPGLVSIVDKLSSMPRVSDWPAEDCRVLLGFAVLHAAYATLARSEGPAA